MSAGRDERATAAAYNRWLREGSLSGVCLRLLMGTAGTYVGNTPVLELAEALGIRPHHRVLDLGCGRATLSAVLASRTGLVEPPVAVDVSTEMLRLSAADRSVRRRVQLAAAAGSALPFADASFHLVLATYIFRQLDDVTLYRVLMETVRVLKPGGIVLAWDYAPTSSRRLNKLHRSLLGFRIAACHLRGFDILAPYAIYAGFKHADRQPLRLPFLFPPIPRVAMMLQKARDEASPGAAEGCAVDPQRPPTNPA